MASFASSATTGGARKHAWTKKVGENNGQLRFFRHHGWRAQARLDQLAVAVAAYGQDDGGGVSGDLNYSCLLFRFSPFGFVLLILSVLVFIKVVEMIAVGHNCDQMLSWKTSFLEMWFFYGLLDHKNYICSVADGVTAPLVSSSFYIVTRHLPNVFKSNLTILSH